MSNSKAELRAKALAARDALSDKQRAAAAQTLAKRGLPFEIAAGMHRLRLFADPQRDRSGAADEEARRGRARRLALPDVNARGKALIFRIFGPTTA